MVKRRDKSAVVPLAHMLTPEGELSRESKDRIDKAIEIFEQDGIDFFVVNSGSSVVEKPGEEIEYTSDPPIYRKMKGYAVERGVGKGRILCEPYSKDTIGEAFYIKALILEPRGIGYANIVTSDYHIPRTRDIFRKFLPLHLTEFTKVDTGRDDSKLFSQEKEKLKTFRKMFQSVKDGYGKEIEKTLYELGLYSSIPKNERLCFY